MPNKKIIKVFGELVKQIEAELMNAQMEQNAKDVQSHTYRLRSIKKALSVLKKLDFEITDASELKGMSDIGSGTLARISEILETGTLAELKNKYDDEKQRKIEGIQTLESVIGIGAAMAKKLVTEYGITSVAELKKAVRDDRVKVSNTIKLGLKYYGKVQGAIPRAEIKQIDRYLRRQAKEIDTGLKTVICGSYRRGKPTSGDIDVLIYHPDVQSVEDIDALPHSHLELFVELLTDEGFLLDNMTDKNYKIKYMGFCRFEDNPVRRIDIKYIPYLSLPTAMLYFTGPFELNTIMRSKAKKRSMHLNEYGIYRVIDGEKELIEVESEEDVFEILGMEYLTPKQREDFSG